MNSIPILSESDLKRFWSKVDKSGECWLWIGSTRDGRYGSLHLGGRKGKNFQTHRIAYALSKGDPAGKAICHSCDNTFCVNPDHLWLGTQYDNIKDRDAKGRKCHKLTVKQVREIFQSKENQYTLASRYGISQVSISDIKTGRTWNQITGLPKLYKKKKV